MTQPTHEQRLREEALAWCEYAVNKYEPKEFSKRYMDWWIENMNAKHREFVEQVRAEIQKMKIETKSEFDVGYEFSTPRLIRHNGYNNGLRNVLSLSLLQLEETNEK